ncbi:hypothetical protein BGZ79_008971 [Entomortierella chlamydospora]|nr:hypothetical protein BGZ79_008971 [Entomortierella chlamydospora]
MSLLADHNMTEYVQPKMGSNPIPSTSSNDTGMEGVEAEVSQLAVHDQLPTVRQSDEDETMGDDDSNVPGLCEDEGSDNESGSDSEDEKKNNDDGQAQETKVEEGTNDSTETEDQDQSQESSSAASSLPTEPSIIHMPDAVYSAVPVSSELYIIPHASKGFNWNEDLFLKPHQRRNLGVDDMYGTDGRSTEEGSHDTAVTVHEIRLDDEESQQILPS